PAARLAKLDVNLRLKDGATGRRAKASSFALLVGQMVLAIVLLAGAGVMVRSFLNIYFADTGARLAGLNAALIQLPASRYPDGDRRRAFFAGLTDRLGSAPEIQLATLANQLPTREVETARFEIEG